MNAPCAIPLSPVINRNVTPCSRAPATIARPTCSPPLKLLKEGIMDSNQASNPQPFAVTGYHDKHLQPVKELRHAEDKDFLADMNEMVDILSYNGRSGVESKADVLFRLILLIEMYATDYATPGAPDKWANHPVETLLN